MANPNKLPVLEVFGPTIQGEGAMIGVQTTFIRSVHCDYLCSHCDSLHAVLPEEYKGKETTYTAQGLFDAMMAIQGNAKWVTISGGNPALWDFSEFISLCDEAGILVAVETQGSVFKPWLAHVDQLTVSPKGPGMGIDEKESLEAYKNFLLRLAEEMYPPDAITVKIPVFTKKDLDFAVKIDKMNPGAQLCLSVGNNYIPGKDLAVHQHRDSLLTSLELLFDEVSKNYPDLAEARILPQLHVLIWGNRQEV